MRTQYIGTGFAMSLLSLFASIASGAMFHAEEANGGAFFLLLSGVLLLFGLACIYEAGGGVVDLKDATKSLLDNEIYSTLGSIRISDGCFLVLLKDRVGTIFSVTMDKVPPPLFQKTGGNTPVCQAIAAPVPVQS